ncbi:phospholipid phosphatase [Serinibacter arcticus]|uniref:Phospholipid phosphatase n=2 Tax=Serinibacter arcticus TaxID=1655435 RepID=A0A2U1ZZM0_9MICO|nr:phospholipid phosphatase [Serinibacter arcticus]
MVVWSVIVGLGFIVKAIDPAVDPAVNEALAAARTPAWDQITAVLSGIATTEVLSATCAVVVLVLWAITREWWYAIVPAVSLATQTAIFLTSSLVVGRERPEVEQLDHSPPTSSFPSGHTGASTAFYLALAVCASRLRSTALRWTAWVLCALVPIAVAFARVYRGMHHPTDVLGGFAVGIACAWIASRYLARVTHLVGSAPVRA